MGLFSFLKKAGSKLFNKKEEPKVEDTSAVDAARKQKEALLKSIVTNLGFKVEGLDVELNDDTATVYGTTDSVATKERVVLAIGNVEGIATVDDRLVVTAPEEAETTTQAESQFYEVQKGDSLSKIAKRFYGNAMKYPVIFEANKPMLSSPDKIYPGQMLRIPTID